MTNNNLKRFWGIEYEEIYTGDFIIWRFHIRNPFSMDGKYRIGINEKLLRMAILKGVSKFFVLLGERKIEMKPPSKKELKRKERMNEFEDRKSMFKGSPPMRIFHFLV